MYLGFLCDKEIIVIQNLFRFYYDLNKKLVCKYKSMTLEESIKGVYDRKSSFLIVLINFSIRTMLLFSLVMIVVLLETTPEIFS